MAKTLASIVKKAGIVAASGAAGLGLGELANLFMDFPEQTRYTVDVITTTAGLGTGLICVYTYSFVKKQYDMLARHNSSTEVAPYKLPPSPEKSL